MTGPIRAHGDDATASRNPFAERPDPPRGAKAARTRSGLVTAARRVFERDGYPNSRIVDITAAAGVAAGTFYTYFDTKEEVFAAVIADLSEEMLYPHARDVVSEDPVVVIEAANRSYLRAYRDNAALLGILEQVALINPQLQQIREQRGLAFIDRNARAIRRLQDDGLADRALDAEVTAAAISAMVSRMAWWVFVAGYDVEFETLVRTLTRLWSNALGITSGATQPTSE